MSEKYDVIIIGAGIGGLTTGAILSKKGKKVLVLEKNPIPGGYAVNFRRGEFEFDASLHLLDGFGEGKISYKFLEETGIDKKIKFLKPVYLYRSIFPDFDFRVPQCDPKAYIDILGNFFPSEKEKIKKIFDLMFKIFCRIHDVGNDKISPADFIDYVDKTHQNVFEQFHIDKKLTAIISQIWPFIGLPSKQLPFLVFLSSWCDFIYNGGYYPEGGGQAISNALVEVIESNKGKVVFSKTVIHILVHDSIAYGVVTNDRNSFLADKIVSNIDARTTFYNLAGRECLSPLFLSEIDRMEPSISAFQVYLGLRIDLRKMGVNDYTIFLNPNYDLDYQYKASLENNFHEAPIEISLYNVLDENGISRDRSVVNIVSLAGYDFWKNFTKDKYKKKKREMADVLIKRTERIVPRLSYYIERMEIATPLTMERYTGNYKGAIYGWSQIISQYGAKRMSQKAPIENLFFSGAWTRPAGGIAGVMQSGVIASNKILNKDF